MNSETVEVINTCAKKSYAGVISFGEVVGELMRVGVESYYADYRAGATTYYTEGAAYSLVFTVPEIKIPEQFSKELLQAAIRGAQKGEVKYLEFLQLSMSAGCVGYVVWISGRHVTYFGRSGAQHIERFPN